MSINLRDIVTEEFQKEIQDSFALATGFGVVFVDTEGNHIGEGGNFTRFCKAINERAIGSEYCAHTNRQAIALAIASNQPSIYICHAGLVNIEIPLVFEGQHVGAITAGQVRTHDPDCYPQDPVPCAENWMDDPELVEFYQEIEILSKEQIEATTTALGNLTNYIIQRYAFAKMQEELFNRRNELLAYQKKQLEIEHQLMVARFDALQKQVTPHFVFNVIDSVSRLIYLQEYQTAQEMLISFSKMMRYSLSNLQSTVSLRQELDFITHYLSIQKIRFHERIEYEIHCEEELEQLNVPFFSLQPVVENSIEHGLLPVSSGGRVRIRCTAENDAYCICVADNGSGLDEERLTKIREESFVTTPSQNGGHVGLYNVYNRFKLMYGEAASVEISGGPKKGVCVEIRISRTYATFAT